MTHQTRPIKLFEGELILRKGDETFSGYGHISAEWRPFPRIRLKINCYLDFPHKTKVQPTGKMQLSARDNPAINFDVYISNVNGHRIDNRLHITICGDLTQPKTIIYKKPIDCSEIRFHLINYKGNFDENIHEGDHVWNGRLRLENKKYEIIVDRLQNANKMIEKMEKFGGYSITHTGSARLHKGDMKYDEADDLLDALYYFFAFLEGHWCGPVLSVGVSNGTKAWEKWDIVTREWFANVTDPNRTNKSVPISGVRDKIRLTPWQSLWMWSKRTDNSSLNQVFKVFMAKWEETSWKDSLKTAIFLYVEANQAAGGTEGAIILAQSALELFASLHADHHLNKKPCKDRFDDIHADERIRWLLDDLDIPVEIGNEVHPDLMELRNHCEQVLKSEAYKDGPRAITLLRNAIIHPSRKKVNKLSQTDDKVKLQLLDLSIWYLEMVLLRLFGYTGQYANRLWRFRADRTGSGFIQQVPWKDALIDSHCDNCPMPLPKKEPS